MEQLVLIVAAILGSTGVAGLLSGGVQWSRAARLRHSVERTTGLIEKVGADTAAGEALVAASQRDAVRLSVMSIIQLPRQFVQMFAGVVFLLVIVVGVTAFTLMSFASRRSDSMLLSMFDTAFAGMLAPMSVGFMLIYVVALLWAMDGRLRVKRDALAWAVLDSGTISQDLIEEHDFKVSPFRRAVAEKAPTSAERSKNLPARPAK